jgi:hypothetical protein
MNLPLRTDEKSHKAEILFHPAPCSVVKCEAQPRAAVPHVYTGCEQWAQRFAAMGMSLKHSWQFLVVVSGGASPRFIRATTAFMGATMKK